MPVLAQPLPSSSYRAWEVIGGDMFHHLLVQRRTEGGLDSNRTLYHRIMYSKHDHAPFRIIYSNDPNDFRGNPDAAQQQDTSKGTAKGKSKKKSKNDRRSKKLRLVLAVAQTREDIFRDWERVKEFRASSSLDQASHMLECWSDYYRDKKQADARPPGASVSLEDRAVRPRSPLEVEVSKCSQLTPTSSEESDGTDGDGELVTPREIDDDDDGSPVFPIGDEEFLGGTIRHARAAAQPPLSRSSQAFLNEPMSSSQTTTTIVEVVAAPHPNFTAISSVLTAIGSAMYVLGLFEIAWSCLGGVLVAVWIAVRTRSLTSKAKKQQAAIKARHPPPSSDSLNSSLGSGDVSTPVRGAPLRTQQRTIFSSVNASPLGSATAPGGLPPPPPREPSRRRTPNSAEQSLTTPRLGASGPRPSGHKLPNEEEGASSAGTASTEHRRGEPYEYNIKIVDTTSGKVYPPNVAPFPVKSEYFTGTVYAKIVTKPREEKLEPYFGGKKRKFEVQFQGRFHYPPELVNPDGTLKGFVCFGAGIPEKLKLTFALRSLGRIIVSVFSKLTRGACITIGNELPDSLPAFTSYAAHAMDALIEADDFKSSPSLGVPMLPDTGDLSRMRKTEKKDKICPFLNNKVYSFSFHSQYASFDDWCMVEVPAINSLSLRKCLGDLPLRVGLFLLPEGQPIETAMKCAKPIVLIEIHHRSLATFDEL